MRKYYWAAVRAAIIPVVCWPQQPDIGCPAFSPDTTIKKLSAKDQVYRFSGGYVAVVHAIAMDNDGSPVSYHPQNHGTADLREGVDPIIDWRRVSDKRRGSPCYEAVKAAIDPGLINVAATPLIEKFGGTHLMQKCLAPLVT
jgi:hypothetical protein